MKLLLKFLLLSACVFPAHAQEPLALKLKPKLATLSNAAAPFNADAAPVVANWGASANPEREAIPGSCTASSNTLCYDYKTGRAVYKPARQLMPEISGMRRESLTLKRDKITFNYSFK